MYSIVMKGQRPTKYAKMVYDAEARAYYKGMQEHLFPTKEKARAEVDKMPTHIQQHMMVCETMIL